LVGGWNRVRDDDREEETGSGAGVVRRGAQDTDNVAGRGILTLTASVMTELGQQRRHLVAGVLMVMDDYGRLQDIVTLDVLQCDK
jgi:hypothetical protein